MGKVKRALISVSDKAGVVEFARALRDWGVEILSTGGTARLLAGSGIAVTDVAAYTGFPEVMDGRVKTLHPKIYGGILGRRGVDEGVMTEHGILAIDLVVVNLYPFSATVADPGCTLDQVVEQIDIGGPAMIRASAKNHRFVSVLVDPGDYQSCLDAMTAHDGQISETFRSAMAAKAFAHTASYDIAIAGYLSKSGDSLDEGFSDRYLLGYEKQFDLRYGENPHQRAAFYADTVPAPGSVGAACQHQGKGLSFNNINDTDAALQCVWSFSEPACVIVKHANPCGVAVSAALLKAYEHAYATDPTSAFGGVIAFNRPLDKATAEAIIGRQFVEVIAAPSVDDDALEALSKKAQIRVLAVGAYNNPPRSGFDYKRVVGGLLVQDWDLAEITQNELQVVSERQPGAQELDDLMFAWRVAKFVKSNAIVYAKNSQTIGIGAGQMSRVYSARLAAIKASDEGLPVVGSVMASDAFFPFRDGIDSAAEVGISAVIEPGGSMRDEEIIAAANEHGMAMVFTGVRHFRH